MDRFCVERRKSATSSRMLTHSPPQIIASTSATGTVTVRASTAFDDNVWSQVQRSHVSHPSTISYSFYSNAVSILFSCNAMIIWRSEQLCRHHFTLQLLQMPHMQIMDSSEVVLLCIIKTVPIQGSLTDGRNAESHTTAIFEGNNFLHWYALHRGQVDDLCSY